MKPVLFLTSALLLCPPLQAQPLLSSRSEASANQATEIAANLLRDRRLVSGMAVSSAVFLAGALLKDKAGPEQAMLTTPPAIDRKFRDWFVNPGKDSNWLDDNGVYYTLAAGLGASLLLPGRESNTENRIRSLLAYTSGFALTGGVTWAIKGLVSRPRPYVYYGTTGSPDEKTAWRSFISGHASAAFYTAAYLHLAWREQQDGTPDRARFLVPAVLYGSATYVAWSRMEIDRHYFTDLVAGAAAGVGIGYLTHWWFRSQAAPATASRPSSFRLVINQAGAAILLQF